MLARERISRHRARSAGRLQPLVLALLAPALLALGGTPAHAGAPAGPGWLSLGVLSGTTAFDHHLADYQWDVTPRAAWGLQALAGRGRATVGLRVWRAGTTQHIDYADVTNAAVHATTADLLGRVRLLAVWGTELDACASAGWIHLGYRPDHVEISASGGPVTQVALGPVNAWSGGGGIAVRRRVIGPWTAAADVERQLFGMKTAHASGGTIVVGRESFGEWSARFELARTWGWR